MSVSIYYKATRPKPMTESERALINIIVKVFSVDQRIEKYVQTGEGHNWESFAIYEKPSAPGVIFEGATKLPDNTEDAAWLGIKHWCFTLSFIRIVLHDAQWQVTVEDHPIKWDEQKRAYDPRS